VCGGDDVNNDDDVLDADEDHNDENEDHDDDIPNEKGTNKPY